MSPYPSPTPSPEERNLAALGTSTGDGRIVNRSPSSVTIPKVYNATLGAGGGGIIAGLLLMILRRTGITLDADEAGLIQGAIELLIGVGIPAIFAWAAGYYTPPAGISAPASMPDPTRAGVAGRTPPL